MILRIDIIMLSNYLLKRGKKTLILPSMKKKGAKGNSHPGNPQIGERTPGEKVLTLHPTSFLKTILLLGQVVGENIRNSEQWEQ